MNKIALILSILLMFLGLCGSVFAAYNFDYFFGFIMPSVNSVVSSTAINTSSPIPQNPVISTVVAPRPDQIAALQVNLNQIKANFAALNSVLAKSNSLAKNEAEDSSKSTFALGIPLLLSEEIKKEEKNTLSVFASLIPPDVRNSPIIVTHLVVLTLGLFGIIVYLCFVRRQEKKRML